MICTKILKILMIVFNSVIFLAGTATVIIGVLFERNRTYALGVLEKIKDAPPQLEKLADVGYVLIALGAIVAIMGFLGCCGAICENKCMLKTFFLIILIMFITEVVAAVLVLLYQPQVQKLLGDIREKVQNSIMVFYGQNDIFTKTWDEAMTLMQCCGYNNYTDFTHSTFVKDNSLYPKFCCTSKPEKCDVQHATSEHVIGCFDAVVNFVKSNSTLLGAGAILIAALEVVVMIMAFVLYKK